MKKEECFLIGYISKNHGFKGELVVLYNRKFPVKLKKQESVFIEIDGNLIPFFIESVRQAGESSVIIKFIDVDSEEKARKLTKCDVYMLLSFLPKQKSKEPIPDDLKGYKIIDDVKGEIGVVVNLLEMPQQLILQVFNGEVEILIPANKEIVYNIDNDKKVILINAPEGLIDIYLKKKT